jgi:hypothetical protein
MKEGVCRPPPHRVEPFPDSPVTMEGSHRPSSMPGWRGRVLAGFRHTARSHSGLARDSGGMHRQAIVPRLCAGHRYTMRSRSQTRPRWWEVRTISKVPTGLQPRRQQARSQTARTMLLLGPCKTRAKNKVGTLHHHRLTHGQTARPTPLLGHPQI